MPNNSKGSEPRYQRKGDDSTPLVIAPTVSVEDSTPSNNEDDDHIVVDLPDGQKIILGSVAPGTVIEIAAWRGVDRPDSRTTRIVLGVANNPSLQEGPVMTNSASPSRRSSRAWIWILSVVAVIAVAALGLMLSPLKFVHPTQGISLGFGNADSAVVLVSPISAAESGLLVVAHKGDDIVVGQIAGVDSGQVLLQAGSSFTQVDERSVFGSVVVIIPCIGLVF